MYLYFDYFLYCYKLQNITIPEGVTWIGQYAFQECLSFTEIRLPKSLQTIQHYAYTYTTNIVSVYLPFVGYSRTATGSDALFTTLFYTANYGGSTLGDTYYAYIKNASAKLGDTNLKTSYTTSEQQFTISDNDDNVIAIINTILFSSSKPNVVDVVDEDGKQLYYTCDNLSITIYSDSAKTNVVATVTSTSNALHTYYTTNGITQGYGYSFTDTTSTAYETYYVHDNANTVTEKLVSSSVSSSTMTRYTPSTLRNIYIFDATKIDNGAFSNLYNINNIIIEGDNLTSIGNGAFYGLRLDDDLDDDGIIDYLWDDVNKEFILNDTSVGTITVENASYKESSYVNSSTIVVPSTVNTIGSFVGKNSTIVNLELPKSLTSVSKHAFEDSERLENVIIETDQDTKIGEYMFKSAGLLENVFLTGTGALSEIPAYAFYDCYKLKLYNASTMDYLINTDSNQGNNIYKIDIADGVNATIYKFSSQDEFDNYVGYVYDTNLNIVRRSYDSSASYFIKVNDGYEEIKFGSAKDFYNYEGKLYTRTSRTDYELITYENYNDSLCDENQVYYEIEAVTFSDSDLFDNAKSSLFKLVDSKYIPLTGDDNYVDSSTTYYKFTLLSFDKEYTYTEIAINDIYEFSAHNNDYEEAKLYTYDKNTKLFTQAKTYDSKATYFTRALNTKIYRYIDAELKNSSIVDIQTYMNTTPIYYINEDGGYVKLNSSSDINCCSSGFSSNVDKSTQLSVLHISKPVIRFISCILSASCKLVITLSIIIYSFHILVFLFAKNLATYYKQVFYSSE